MASYTDSMDYSHDYSDCRFEFAGLGPDTRPEQSWLYINPYLDPFQYECQLRPKVSQNLLCDPLMFQQTTASRISYSSLTEPLGIYGMTASTLSWNTSQPDHQSLRCNSPDGNYTSVFSASSSECSVGQGISSITDLGSPIQSFAFAPMTAECEPVYGQPSWLSGSCGPTSLPSPPDSTAGAHRPIALRELEFQATSEYPIEPFSPEESLVRVTNVLPMHAPEELELSDSLTSLATLIRSTTTTARSPAEEDSSQDERDRESDLDFDPHRSRNKTRTYNLARQSGAQQSRLPQTSTTSNTSPLLDRTSRIQKPNRRVPSQNNKEKIRYKIGARSNAAKTKTTAASKTAKPFPCSFHKFGCDAVFANKNEWKRHVSSQHLQLGVYRCDLGSCNPDNADVDGDRDNRPRRKGNNMIREEEEKVYNDFNRKDLFTQHCRRMHGPQRYLTDGTSETNQKILQRLEQANHSSTLKSKPAKSVITKDDEQEFEAELGIIRKRCWQVRRTAPTRSCCGFCNKVFEIELTPGQPQKVGHVARDDDQEDPHYGRAQEKLWEERMEHVSRHYEQDNKSSEQEDLDEDLQDWGLEVGVLERIIDNNGVERAYLVGRDPTDEVLTTALNAGVSGSTQVSPCTPRRSGLRTRHSRPGHIGDADDDQDEDTVMQHEYQPSRKSALKHETSDDDALAEDE